MPATTNEKYRRPLAALFFAAVFLTRPTIALQPPSNNLYLLRAYPAGNTIANFPAILYYLRQSPEPLQAVRIISIGAELTQSVVFSDQLRMIVLALSDQPQHFELISMERPLEGKAIDFPVRAGWGTPGPLIFWKKKGSFPNSR
jgi:hypothetical protein